MSELSFIFIVVVWYGLSLYLSETKENLFQFGKQWLFFISMVFSPLIGLIALLIFKNKITAA